MKKIMLSISAVMLPCVTFFALDNPGAAIVALALQGTIIGWPVATIWAFKTIKEEEKRQRDGAKSREQQS